jgi:hypothetical protein
MPALAITAMALKGFTAGFEADRNIEAFIGLRKRKLIWSILVCACHLGE